MPYSPMTENEIDEVKALNVELYNIKQVALLLKVSERTIFNYLKQGKIKGKRLGGGKWMFTRQEIDDFING